MKIQLIATFVGIIILIVLASFVVILRNQLEVRDFELQTANDTIKVQAESIARVIAQRKIDDRIVTEFTKGLAELRTTAEAQTTAIADLEKSDPNVKSFLDTILPGGLGVLLSDTPTTNSDGDGKPAR